MAGPLTHLIQQERTYYFIDTLLRGVVYSVSAQSMDEAWQRFYASPKAGFDIFCVVKTETEIYLAE